MASLKKLKFKIGDVIESRVYKYLVTEYVNEAVKYNLKVEDKELGKYYVYKIKNLDTGKHYNAIPKRIHKTHKFVEHKPELLVLFGESRD